MSGIGPWVAEAPLRFGSVLIAPGERPSRAAILAWVSSARKPTMQLAAFAQRQNLGSHRPGLGPRAAARGKSRGAPTTAAPRALGRRRCIYPPICGCRPAPSA